MRRVFGQRRARHGGRGREDASGRRESPIIRLYSLNIFWEYKDSAHAAASSGQIHGPLAKFATGFVPSPPSYALRTLERVLIKSHPTYASSLPRARARTSACRVRRVFDKIVRVCCIASRSNGSNKFTALKDDTHTRDNAMK